jgi:RNA polymerase sigma-70 factor (ECF subfamily)
MNNFSQSWLFNDYCINRLCNDFKRVKENDKIKIYFDNYLVLTSDNVDKPLFFETDIFKEFILNIHNYIENPLFLTLKVKDSCVDLGIIFDDITVNNEKYFKYFLISDSIDNKIALQTNICLLHQNTNNIFIVNDNIENVTNKWKFSNKSFSERINNFNESFSNIDNVVTKYVDLLHKTYNIKTSYKKFVEKIIEYEDNKKIKSNLRYNVVRLNKNIKNNFVQEEDIKTALSKPETFLSSNLDITINSNKLFHSYINLFQEYNIVTITRESNRAIKNIFEILDESNIKNKYEHIFEVKTGINFQRFYANHFNKLTWFLSKYTNDIEKAQDFANEAFIQGLDKINTYDPNKSKIHTWIYRIGENLVRKNYKDEQKLSTISFDKSTKDDLNLLNVFYDKSDNSEELKNELYIKKAEILKDTIYNLPEKYEKYRTVLIMREIEEMQYKDISEQLNINLSTIKSQISKGRKIVIKRVEKIFEKLDKEETIDI